MEVRPCREVPQYKSENRKYPHSHPIRVSYGFELLSRATTYSDVRRGFAARSFARRVRLHDVD